MVVPTPKTTAAGRYKMPCYIAPGRCAGGVFKLAAYAWGA